MANSSVTASFSSSFNFTQPVKLDRTNYVCLKGSSTGFNHWKWP